MGRSLSDVLLPDAPQIWLFGYERGRVAPTRSLLANSRSEPCTPDSEQPRIMGACSARMCESSVSAERWQLFMPSQRRLATAYARKARPPTCQRTDATSRLLGRLGATPTRSARRRTRGPQRTGAALRVREARWRATGTRKASLASTSLLRKVHRTLATITPR